MNRVDVTDSFDVNSEGAVSASVPLEDDAVDTLVATINGWDYDFDPRLDSAMVIFTVITPGCPTSIAITEAPSDPYYQGTADFTVAYTKNPLPRCASVDLAPVSSTFKFYADTNDVTWPHFTAGASLAHGLDVPLIDGQTNTFRAAVTGYDDYGNQRRDSVTITRYVDASPGPTVNLTAPAGENQLLSLCEAACFDATAAVSTVPYFSLDAPRNVTLVYHGGWAKPRPIVHAEVSLPPNATTPEEYWLQVKLDGSLVTFTNGQDKLYFAGSSQRVRLAAQFDASAKSTGIYPLQVIVTAKYPTTTEVRTIDSRVIVVNEGSSVFGRGWTMAGLQKLVADGDTVLVVDGSGTATRFILDSCSLGTCSYTAPEAEYSRLTRSGILTFTYTRAYPDSTKVKFDNVGRMTSATDRFGNVIGIGYDGSGRVNKIEDPIRTHSGSKSYISIAYGTYGISQVKDPGANGSQTGGRTTTFVVNSSGNLTSVTQPSSSGTTAFAYDGSSRLSTITDAGSAVTTLHYNSNSWLLDSISLPAVALDTGSGPLATLSPRTMFSPWQTVGIPTGSTSSGTLAAVVDPDTVKARVTDAKGHSSSFTVDKWGQPLVVVDSIGTTTITRNGLFATGIVAPTGRTDLYTYDGPFLTEIRLEGQKPQYVRYGAYAQVDSTWGPGRIPTRSFLGTGGRVDSVRFAGSSVTKFTYNTRGQVLTIKDPQNHLTKYHYQSHFGNLDSTLAPGNLYTRVRFDAFGRDSTVQSTGQPWRKTVYDVLNRPIELHDGVNTDPTLMGYDELYLVRVEDSKEQVYRLERNALGWVTREFDPADTVNVFIRYDYNPDGLVTRTKNRRGDTILVSYDAAHRVRSKSGQNVVVDSFAYAQNGRQVTAWNSVSRNELHFAESGWQDSAVTEIAGKRFRIHYLPDTLQRLDSVSIASNSGITFMPRSYLYSGFTGKLFRITLNGQNTTLNTTLDLLPSTFTYPTSVGYTSHLWTANHGLYDKTFSKTALDTGLRRAYGYDKLGRVAEYLERANNQWVVTQYAYDSLGRLTKRGQGTYASCAAPDTTSGYNCRPDGAAPDETYGYDEAGNRSDYTVAAGNRIQSGSIHQFSHDLDGNVSSKWIIAPFHVATYKWSADQRLREVTYDGDTLQYQYDPFGRLVRKQRKGATERYFLWDGDQLLAEVNATATARIGEYAYFPGIDRPLAFATGATSIAKIRYYAQDALGNVIGVIKDSTIAAELSYTDLGQLANPPALSDTSRLHWKGLIREDDITNMYYVRNRWYDPIIGRFISEDPIGLAGGINKYAFGGGDPINSHDPLGLKVQNDTPPTPTLAPVEIKGKRNDPLCAVENHCRWSGQYSFVSDWLGGNRLVFRHDVSGGGSPIPGVNDEENEPTPSFGACLGDAGGVGLAMVSAGAGAITAYGGKLAQQFGAQAVNEGNQVISRFFGSRALSHPMFQEGLTLISNGRNAFAAGSALVEAGVVVGAGAVGYLAGASIACAVDRSAYR